MVRTLRCLIGGSCIVLVAACSDDGPEAVVSPARSGSPEQRDATLESGASEKARELFAEGNAKLERGDKVAFLKAMTAASELGHAGATFELGRVAPDDESALRFFAIAAKKGHVRAMFNLGTAYEERGDLEQAESWYRKASEGGSVRAKNNLGTMYATTKRDPAGARPWFEAAAAEGDTDAMMGAASSAYQTGDRKAALRWAKLAKKHGHPAAARFLRQLERVSADK